MTETFTSSRSHRRSGLHRSVLSFLLAVAVPAAAISCKEAAQAAIESLPSTQVGIEWPCCSRETAQCRVDLAECNTQFPDFSTCFAMDGSVACQLSNTTSSGAPCGAFKGEAGPPGLSVIAGHELTFGGLEATVRSNWKALGLGHGNAACCSRSTGACYLEVYEEDNVNPCTKGYYEILCAGDEDQGICSVYANTVETEPLNAYFRVNLVSESSTAASDSTTGTTTSSTAPVSSTPANQGSLEDADKRHGPNPLVIALPVVLVALVAVTVAFSLLRRGRRRQRGKEEDIPTPFSGSSHQPLTSTTEMYSYQGTRGDSDPFNGTSHYAPTAVPSTQTPFDTPTFSTGPPPRRPSGKGTVAPSRPADPAPPYTVD